MRTAGLFVAVCLLAVTPVDGRAEAAGKVSIVALSNRPDLVSGGDVLVRVELPRRAGDAALGLNGRRIRGALHRAPDGRGYLARVEGLRVGPNTVTVSSGGRSASLAVTNHPLGGPVISGAQVKPWICKTQDFGLGAPRDAQCNVRTVYEVRYKSSVTQLFSPYDPDNPPVDLATTTTDRGVTVPYIVRVERGVVNRGIYEMAALYDPRKPWEPWAPQRAFNGKLLVPFGGGCEPRHAQAAPTDPMDDAALSRGFGVIASSHFVPGQNCNDVVIAETLMMLKERFIERYGLVRYTISNGLSGGTMAQLSLASNYPGLLDGVQLLATYPDIWNAVLEAQDCHLMDRYFDRASPHLWLVPQQQSHATGYFVPTTCRGLWDLPVTAGYSRTWFDPDNFEGCIGDLKNGAAGSFTMGIGQTRPDWVYDARTNRKGTRCTVHDYMVSVFGRRKDGFANRPFDNVGVQYGLRALEAGQILPEQFVDLNEKVGGIDIDWNWQPRRSVADPAALRVAYRSGRVASMREARNIAIVDMPLPVSVEIHTPFHSWVVKDRLKKANGHADNHVIQPVGAPSFDLIDEWLAGVERDKSGLSLERRIARNRPEDAVDACGAASVQITDASACGTLFPRYGDPRIAAGGPPTDDVLKCRLKPVRRSDYEVVFSDAQWERLRRAFRSGVCDYTKPSVGAQASIPWMTFAHGPGGAPLGPVAVSR